MTSFVLPYFLKALVFSLFVSSAAKNFKFLGCFLEENLLSLGDESRVITPVSPESCSTFCNDQQYLFFILKHDTCYCGKNYVSRLMKQFDHECTKKCTGDEKSSCGGPKVVSSYTTDSSISSNFLQHGGYPIPIYLGCYSETPNDAENRLLKGPAGAHPNNDPMECSKMCFKMGYLYFGVTFGSECWCGNQKPSSLLQVEEINCNSPCSGDSEQMCGGGWKIGIYSTGMTDFLAKKYVGCFENEERKPKGKHLSFQMGSNNSPDRCMNLCNAQRFKYASVKGDVCECKNYEVNFSLKRSASDCQTVCPENPSKYCGGSVTSSVYKTLYADPQGKVSVNHKGCFKSIKRHPILHGWKITSNKLTPKYCVYSCYARRFPYAALTSSKECVCSFIAPSDEARTENAECSTVSCSQQQHSCGGGGHNAMDVYGTGMQWKTEAVGRLYLGCFEESEGNRIFDGYAQSFSTNTPGMCSDLCYKLGYTYSGVTYKDGCFCGSQSPSELTFPRVEDKQCNAKCSGDANQFCGGGWRMGVFRTGLNDFPVEDRLLGCFVQEEDTLPDMKFELINTNTPSKCSAICNSADYKFAGVMGVKCLCSNRAPKNEQKADESDCDINCAGGSSKTCGGENRIQIYDLKKETDTINGYQEFTEPVDFVDEFDTLNLQSRWSHDVYIAQEPDYEFVVYNNSEKCAYVKDGELIIQPSILSDSFVRRGYLNLKRCTKYESNECTKNASSFNIIPPIVSGKLTTKYHFSALYGHFEVVAKLPAGDWIVSEISLISISNEKNKLVLANLLGNSNLNCDGVDESAHVLKYGLQIDEQHYVSSNTMKSTKSNLWTDGYHSFALSWTPENTIFKIDGETGYLETSNLPLDAVFDSNFYLSIAVSVGGITHFRDGCTSNGRLKPWTNQDPKAMFSFWKDKSYWESTWHEEKSTLRVKKVKFIHN